MDGKNEIKNGYSTFYGWYGIRQKNGGLLLLLLVKMTIYEGKKWQRMGVNTIKKLPNQ